MTHTDLISQSAFEDIIDTLPCSVSQTRFWFLEKMEPGNTALNVAVRWEIRGRFNAENIERAFRMVIDRHEVLRTRFVEKDGEPMQQIVAAAPFKLSIIDLTRLPDATRMEEARSISIREAQTPFDLTQAPLIRATMLQLAEDRAQLLITVHHIAFDGWSIRVLGREIGKIASALDAGRAPEMPELQLQYADFSLWQRDFMQSESFAEDTAYWVEKLSDAPYFEIPTDKTRPPRQTFGGEIVSLVVPGEVSDKLTELARREGVSLFSLGAATITTALHRFTGESDIVIGTQVANRDDTDLEDLIGVFINNIVLRLDAQGNPTFIELLQRSSAIVQEGLTRTHVPFDDLVRKLRRTPDLSRSPLYSVNFIFQGAFMENARYGGFDLTGLPSESPGALLDFNFLLVRRPDHWRASLEFNTDLFDKATAQRLLDLWALSMKAAAETPAGRISELNVISREDYSALANRRPIPDYPRDKNAAAIFAEVAAVQPHAIALTEGARNMSYAELERRANQMARMLQNLGARKGRRIAVVAPRSIETIITFLAAIKTGAAYMPLDADYPTDRLDYMLDDCAPAVLVAHKDAREKVSHFKGPIIDLDVASADSAESDAPVLCEALATDPIYLMYTSGSSGKPKGALVPHRGIVRFALAQDKLHLGPPHTFLHTCALAFDASAQEIWCPLLSGARVSIVRNHPPSVSDIADAIAETGVTAAVLPTAIFHLLAEHRPQALRGLKQLIVGGEVLSPAAVRRVYGAVPEIEILNGYGPTENTVVGTVFPVPRDFPLDTPLPIGAPVRATDVYVVDRYGHLAPPGGIGELYLGGDGVAIGYHNRPDLTAEKFVPDTFSGEPGEPGARLYRTGDITRLRPDGLLDYVGRSDFQVKVRGMRIELGEIESALVTHDSVGEAVVITRETPTVGKALFAYVTPSTDRIEPLENLPSALHAYLNEKLPRHMVPSAISVLRTLPQTPNGKVDRRALPEIDAFISQALSAPNAAPAENLPDTPLNETQLRVRTMWQTLLKTDKAIGLDDSFFDLGGHSLLALRLLARVEEEFGRKLEILTLFRQPTLRQFSALLSDVPAARAAATVEDWQIFKLQPNGSKPPIIAIDNPILYYALSKRLGADQPFTSLQLYNPDRPQALDPQSFPEVAAQYIRLLKIAHPKGPYILTGLCIAGSLAVEVARQLQAAGDTVEAVIAYDAWRPGYTKSLPLHQRLAIGLADRLDVHARRWRSFQKGDLSFEEWATSFKFMQKFADIALKLNLLKQAPKLAESFDPPWYQRHLVNAREGYMVNAYEGDLLLFKSEQALRGPYFDADLGWARITNGRTELHGATGNHLSMLAEPNAEGVAKIVADFLSAKAR